MFEGGSENVKKSHVEAGSSKVLSENYSTGFEKADRLREAVYINLGLLALKKCITALNNNSPFVPFKDSKLTQLLSRVLGAKSKSRVAIVVCCAQEVEHIAETLSTLRFGEICSNIELEVRNNATVLANIIKQINGEISSLEAVIKEKERWVLKEIERFDALAEENSYEAAIGGREVKKVYMLVGAEKERAVLHSALQRRSSLLGVSTESVPEEKTGVFGFGDSSDFGAKFDSSADILNDRFEAVVSKASLPAVVAAKGKQWKVGQIAGAKSSTSFNRNKAVYSGISA